MAEEVDVSALAELVRIRHEEDLLRERLEKMEARKSAVSEVVYRRVKGDYEAQKNALEAQAREPRARAGREYAKLRVLAGEAGRLLDEARLAREEIDFRHELGEFDEETYGTRRQAGEELLGQRQARVDELAKLKERFLEAFPSEEDLDRAAGPAKAAPPAPKPEPAKVEAAKPEPPRPEPKPEPLPEPKAPPPPGTIKGAVEQLGAPPPDVKSGPIPAPPTTIMPPPPVPMPVPPAPLGAPRGATVLPPPPAFSPDATVAGPPPERSPAFSPDATALGVGVAVATPPPPVEQRSATIQMQVSRILVVQEDGQGPEYVLKPEPTSVGRAPESTIRLAYPDVSRQHAMIFPTEGGFKISDRGSPNGLFVNGARVKEHLLADGDVIQVGRRKLVFHC